MTARKCEICGKQAGEISCYRSAFHSFGLPKSYAHKKCFERWRIGKIPLLRRTTKAHAAMLVALAKEVGGKQNENQK